MTAHRASMGWRAWGLAVLLLGWVAGATDGMHSAISPEFALDTRDPVSTPSFAADGGLFAGVSIEVTVSCASADATIRYTADGQDPTEASPAIGSPATVALRPPGDAEGPRLEGWPVAERGEDGHLQRRRAHPGGVR